MNVIHDLRVALRGLRRRPGYTLTVVATLGLGIGANSAIFSVVRGAVWWALPYADPDRILWHSDGRTDGAAWGSSQSLPNLLDLRASVTTLSAFEAYRASAANVSGGDAPARVTGLDVGPRFLEVLGVRPARGRDFQPADNVVGAVPTVLLSHALWRDAFGADPALIGGTVELDAVPHTVLGVLPESFEFGRDVSFLASARYDGAALYRGTRQYNAVSRMRPGVELQQVEAELRTLFADLSDRFPDDNDGWTTTVRPVRAFLVPSATANALTLQLGAVALILLMACVNVANLVLVRSESRRREFALRGALGADRMRLFSVFLSESVLLGVLGGVVGLALAFLSLPVLLRVYGAMLPRPDAVALDGVVTGFTLAIALLAGVLVGVVPAVRHRGLRRGGLGSELREGARTGSRAARRFRAALVVGEVALATVLVAAAALLTRSYTALGAVETGLAEPDHVLVARITVPSGRYPDAESWSRFFAALTERVGGVPGVRSAGVTTRMPLNGGTNVTTLWNVARPEVEAGFVELRVVTPGLFDALGLRLLAGRGLRPEDGETGTSLVITRTLAEGMFGGAAEAIGGGVRWSEQQTDPLRVVGVVDDLRDLGVTRPPPPGMYQAFGPATAWSGQGVLVVRTENDPLAVLPALRRAVAELDPTVPLDRPERMTDVMRRGTATERLSSSFFGLFALLALALGAVGVYGVMAYSVAERTREMGIRVALGASGADVRRQVVRSGLGIVGLGLLGGLALSVAGAGLLESRLHDVSPTDPVIHGVVALILCAVALAASWIPARRASAVDPVEALRAD